MKVHTLFFLYAGMFTLSICSMDDTYEQLHDLKAKEQQQIEDMYQYLSHELRISHAQIHEIATEASGILARAIEECSTQGKLSVTTIQKLIAVARKTTVSEKEIERIKNMLLQQATTCGLSHMLMLKQYAHNAKKFQEFVEQKQQS